MLLPRDQFTVEQLAKCVSHASLCDRRLGIVGLRLATDVPTLFCNGQKNSNARFTNKLEYFFRKIFVQPPSEQPWEPPVQERNTLVNLAQSAVYPDNSGFVEVGEN